MKETNNTSTYFTGISEAVKIDDKRRFTIPSHTQYGGNKNDLAVVRTSLDEAKVLALTDAQQFFARTDEVPAYAFPFVRPTSQDQQRRIRLSKGEFEHVNATEVVLFGLGRMAVVAAKERKQDITKYFMGQLSADYEQGLPTIDGLLKIIEKTAEVPLLEESHQADQD